MRPGKVIFILGLLLLASFLSLIPNITYASESPIVRQRTNGNECSPVSSCSIGFPKATLAGGAIVAGVQSDSSKTQNPPTDDGGDTFVTVAGEPCDIFSGSTTCFWVALNIKAGTSTVTATTSGNTGIDIWTVELRNVDLTIADYCAADGRGTAQGTPVTVTTDNSCSFTQGHYVLLSQFAGTFTAGAGFTTACAISTSFRCAFDYNGSVSSPTSFPWSGNFGSPTAYRIVGIAIPDSTIDKRIVVNPCNFFQFQCWMYPALMMSLVGGLVFATVEPGRPSKKALGYILLSSFTLTSGVEVLMGLLPITMPLLLTILTVVYAWRFQ